MIFFLRKYCIITLKFLIAFWGLDFYCQGEANNWYFGVGAGLNFSSGSPVPLVNGQTNNQEGCASISDSSGNLLFYSDGIRVWNSLHQVMTNGNDLHGHDSGTQSATIIKKPGSLNIYYVFTIDAFVGSNGFKYSLVDISLDAGLGEVVSKNIPIYSPTCEKISIVKKSNNIDYWVITHDWSSNVFYAHELNSSGLNTIPITSSVGTIHSGSNINSIGYMKISPNGSKIALASSGLDIVELFDFNNITGSVSNPQIIISEVGELYGLEFSLNNSILYVSNLLNGKIHQFNLLAPNIALSKITIYIGNKNPSAMQLGPNGKIYIAVYNKDKIGVINNPNSLGSSCNLEIDGIDLGGKICYAGLPAFNQSFFFNSEIKFDNACQGSSIQFEINSNQDIIGVIWNFGDGTFSTNLNPNHTYTNSGTYTVTASITSDFGTIIKIRELIVTQAPTVSTPILVFCDNTDGTYNIETTNLEANILQGQQGLTVNYFTLNGNVIPKPLSNPLVIDSKGLLIDVFDALSPNCIVRLNVAFNPKLTPKIELIGKRLICKNEPSTKIEAQIINGTPLSIYSYQWSLNGISLNSETNSQIDINVSGIYSVMVTSEFGCKNISQIVLTESEKPSIVSIKVDDLNANNTITIFVNGIGNYEYSLDNLFGEYQSQNIFYNVKEGSHIIYVKDINGCGVSSELTSVIKTPNYFTPNGDGFNDFWNVKSNSVASIYIYNRFGKLLKQLNPIDIGWDGIYNGNSLPSDDYWFVINLKNNQIIKGHFTLKR